MSGPKRYYSQQYSPLDEPSAAHSDIGLNQYTGYDGPRGQEDIGYEPHRHQDLESFSTQYDRTPYQPPQSHAAPYENPFNQEASRGPSPIYEDDYHATKLPPRPAKRAWYTGAMAGGMSWWNRQTRKMKYILMGSVAAFIILLIIIIGVAAAVSSNNFNYEPLDVQVRNPISFETGGATREQPQSNTTGVGAGQDVYTYYSGDASNFPTSDQWVSYEDMWKKNLNTFRTSCGYLGHGADNTESMIEDINWAIQNRANASLVDHRLILATVLQESNGCPRAGATTSSGGVRNPGLMQSHNGHAYCPSHSTMSILQMIQDGTQGTEHGDGIVQNLDLYGDPYSAARGYNSGYIPKSGDLSEAAGATKCYVSDIANRLTGWVRAKSSCEEE
ncbi:hypothetical protein LTR37_002765 [Vermiconidia calcicola]|uniref:Uncharacterized protein n=1 Tax=Vermiconidia calcicola TaxID=1690605 RepID=A0ACC3NS52_9PEZI|nr:hypothetical protein LTR37_002765 [Vermiconidia calcicola]